jgi:cephalosporin-C deacetylase
VIDCLLAIRILKKMEQIDTDRIGVMGTSQGGALSLMTASLDDMARVVSCDIPWLTNFEYQLNHDVEGPYNEIKEFIRRFPEKSSSVVNTLGYFDSLFFADTVKRPVLVSLGQSDNICPPDSVRDLFGRLPSIKALLEIPGMAHERSTVWRYMSQKWFDFYL